MTQARRRRERGARARILVREVVQHKVVNIGVQIVQCVRWLTPLRVWQRLHMFFKPGHRAQACHAPFPCRQPTHSPFSHHISSHHHPTTIPLEMFTSLPRRQIRPAGFLDRANAMLLNGWSALPPLPTSAPCANETTASQDADGLAAQVSWATVATTTSSISQMDRAPSTAARSVAKTDRHSTVMDR
jgi:hypothetical protein